MYSFLSDFAIGIGGSDSGGSIQQLLMDWEVISISGSSSEDTRCGASDNESSSSERLRASRRTSGGTSCLYGRAWPSAASSAGEPILITMILPLQLLGEQGEAMGTWGHHLMCDVAIMLGHHRPHLPLLAMNGWGTMFWSISHLSPLWRVSLLCNAMWNWRTLRTLARWLFKLARKWWPSFLEGGGRLFAFLFHV